LQVKQLRPGGVVVLQDKAGQEFVHQVSQLAPCHLPNIDGALDRTLMGEDKAAECVVCGSAGDGAVFMFCDNCNSGWHTYCCTPPLAQVPEGDFLCEHCRAAGVQLSDLQQRRQEGAEREAPATLFPLAAMRQRDTRACALHGRLVTRKEGRRNVWGVVCFKGATCRPHYFKLLFADGGMLDGVSHQMLTKGKSVSLRKVGECPPAGCVLPDVGEAPRI
jgi:hypothetical protein